MLDGPLHTRHRSVPRATIAKAAGLPAALPTGDEFFVASVLTLPVRDLAGDIVRPEGLTWDQHKRAPFVDFEHGRHPEVGSVPVGWARKSLGRPGGEYAVWKCRLPDGVETYVGGTYFDRDDTLGRQICFGVRDGQWPGVSLEFMPDWRVAKSLGRSPLENRDAYDFPVAHVVRWTHCAEPVCPGAVSVLKSLPGELEPLVRTLRDGTIRGEPLHPLLLKCLEPYRPATKFVTVPAEKKAMDTPDDPQTVYDPAVPEDAGAADDASDSGGATPSAQVGYDAAEAIQNVRQTVEAGLKSGEHVAAKKKYAKLNAEADALAKKYLAVADMVHDDVGGAGDMEADDDVPEPDEADMTPDDEGVPKAMSAVRRKAYRPRVLKSVQRRAYTLAQLEKGITAAKAPEPAEDPRAAKERKRRDRAARELAETFETFS